MKHLIKILFIVGLFFAIPVKAQLMNNNCLLAKNNTKLFHYYSVSKFVCPALCSGSFTTLILKSEAPLNVSYTYGGSDGASYYKIEFETIGPSFDVDATVVNPAVLNTVCATVQFTICNG